MFGRSGYGLGQTFGNAALLGVYFTSFKFLIVVNQENSLCIFSTIDDCAKDGGKEFFTKMHCFL